MKGFKAFGKGLVCRGKQYKENTVFEESKAVICWSGMHFCETPLDVLDYYPLVDDNGNIVEISNFGMVIFWGLILFELFNNIITRAIFTNAKNK